MSIHLYPNDLPDDLVLGPVVAIDTETMGLDPRRDRLCLVQLSSGDGDAHLVQIARGQTAAPRLMAMLTDPGTLKLFHFGRFDIAAMERAFGVITAPVWCTKIASKLVRTFTDRHGLKYLLNDMVGVDVSKQQQTSDWGAETLTDAQKEYAASDVLHLHALKAELEQRLAREGRTALAQAILTVDQEAIYRRSRWGQRAEAEIAEQSRKVAADNDTAFAALVADEDALTRARATLDPAEFRRRATAFDERVTAVRQERDDARLALARQADRDRALFFQAAGPVLTSVMEQRGALLVLDQRTVLISAETIDVTAATIAALDAALGDGSEIVAAAIADEEAAATRPAPGADADPAAPAATTGTDTPIAPTDAAPATPTPAPDRAP